MSAARVRWDVKVQIPLCTARDLEELGIARDAIQGIPLDQRKRTIRRASGVLAPYLRKRAELPLVPTVDDEEISVALMTGGASVAHEGGPATRARDVAVKFTAGGTVGVPGVLVAVNLDHGAFGSAFSAPVALPNDGKITIDGYIWTIDGTIATADLFTYSTRIDPGVSTAAAQVAAFLLLGNRGVPAETLETLKALHDAAIAWTKDVGKGEGDLEYGADASPDRDEGGPLFSSEANPYSILDTEPDPYGQAQSDE